MHAMQRYLGEDYPSSHGVASGGDQLTCERQKGAQHHLMDGESPREQLQLLEPLTEYWECASGKEFKQFVNVISSQIVLKYLFEATSRDHKTLR